MRGETRAIALGGMLTAVAVTVMCLGSVIPVNTYICPVLAILICRPVLKNCGRKIAFCYYLATMALSLMLAPDREAAIVYALVGYYPLIQPVFHKIRVRGLRILAKLGFFTLTGAASFALSMYVLGQWGQMLPGEWVLMGVTLLVWDILLMMVDVLLIVGVRIPRRKS